MPSPIDPAKVARGLAQRIYQHLRNVYGLAPGSIVLDPFLGIGGFAHDALLQGYTFVGMELEAHFHTLALANLALWQRKYAGWPQYGTAHFLQGDSRHLRAVLAAAGLGQVGCVMGSPPFSPLGNQPTGHTQGVRSDYRQGLRKADSPTSTYGTTPGQLGALPAGTVDAVISSPPDEGSWHAAESTHINEARMRAAGYPDAYIATKFRASKAVGGNLNATAYGSSPGPLGARPAGTVEAVGSSPPFADVEAFKDKDFRQGRSGRAEQYAKVPYERRGFLDPHYTEKAQNRNLASFRNCTPTFWAAARDIVRECVALLAPGGLAVWVVKPFVRDKTLVDFPGDWQRLCEACGLVLVERIEASLIEEYGTQEGLFGDGPQKIQTARKSFFRRLAEKRPGTPQIDSEVVLICTKPAEARPYASIPFH